MFPRMVGGSVRVFAALLTPWVFFTSVYFIYYHNNINFPIFSPMIVRQLLRKFEKRFISTFPNGSKIKYANMHGTYKRLHMHILPPIAQNENTSSYFYFHKQKLQLPF